MCPEWESDHNLSVHRPTLQPLSHTSQGGPAVLRTFQGSGSLWLLAQPQCGFAQRSQGLVGGQAPGAGVPTWPIKGPEPAPGARLHPHQAEGGEFGEGKRPCTGAAIGGPWSLLPLGSAPASLSPGWVLGPGSPTGLVARVGAKVESPSPRVPVPPAKLWDPQSRPGRRDKPFQESERHRLMPQGAGPGGPLHQLCRPPKLRGGSGWSQQTGHTQQRATPHREVEPVLACPGAQEPLEGRLVTLAWEAPAARVAWDGAWGGLTSAPWRKAVMGAGRGGGI